VWYLCVNTGQNNGNTEHPKKLAPQLKAAHRTMKRKMLGISWQGHIANDTIKSKTKLPDLKKAQHQKWKWAGHMGVLTITGQRTWQNRNLILKGSQEDIRPGGLTTSKDCATQMDAVDGEPRGLARIRGTFMHPRVENSLLQCLWSWAQSSQISQSKTDI